MAARGPHSFTNNHSSNNIPAAIPPPPPPPLLTSLCPPRRRQARTPARERRLGPFLLAPRALRSLRVCVQAVEACVEANMELCCLLFQRAAVDRAIAKVDEVLVPNVRIRKQWAESGSQDPNVVFGELQPWVQHLPTMLQPRSTTGPGLSQQQLLVYDSFARPSKPSVGFSLSVALSGGAAGPGGEVAPAGHPSRPMLSLAAAQEEYAVAVDKLDTTAQTVIANMGGRGVSLFSLPPDHPINGIIAAVRRVTDRTSPEQRDQSACLFAHRLLRRLYDGPGEGLAAQVRACVRAPVHVHVPAPFPRAQVRTSLQRSSVCEPWMPSLCRVCVCGYALGIVSPQIHLKLLTSIRDQCKLLPREVTAWVAQAAETPPGKLPVNVVSSLLAVSPPLVALPDLDLLLFKLMDSGRAPGAVMQVRSLVCWRECARPCALCMAKRSASWCCCVARVQVIAILQRVMCVGTGSDRPAPLHPQQLQHTMALLVKLAASRPPVVAVLPSFIESMRAMYNKGDAPKVRGEPAPPPFPTLHPFIHPKRGRNA